VVKKQVPHYSSRIPEFFRHGDYENEHVLYECMEDLKLRVKKSVML
jgi:hypothetical protein